MREYLKGLNLDKEVMEGIIAEHGKEVTALTEDNKTLKQEKINLEGQVSTLSKNIEDLKKIDPTKLQETITQLQKDNKDLEENQKKELAKVKFDSKLDLAITNSKTKDPIALKAHLNIENLKYDDKTDSIVGFSDQLTSIKEKQKYLFEEEEAGGAPQGTAAKKDVSLDDDIANKLFGK